LARLVYYNGLLICWISKTNHIDWGLFYKIVDYFPSLNQDNPTYASHELHKDFEVILEETKERF
jgi:hypothetical protein